MIVLDINAKAVVAFTNKLEKMHRSALPAAIRGALNDAALNVKQKTMPKHADDAFVKREANFFKANSKVEFAKGFDLRSMKSTVGFVESKLKGGNTNYAVKDLEQQEHGGDIAGRSFVPLDTSRTGNNNAKRVKKQNALKNIKNVISASKVNTPNKKQKFIRAAIMAKKLYGNDGYVLGNFDKGRRTLSRINSVSSDIGGKKLVIDRTPLYTYKKGFQAKVKRTDFMKRASLESAMSIDKYFVRNAQKQFERLQK